MAELQLNRTLVYVFLASIVAVIATFISYQTWVGAKTEPPATVEGFSGPPRGVGLPDCVTASSDTAKLYTMLASRASTTEEGPDDLREFTVLLGKLACFKRDLLSPSGIVLATRGQPFQTSLDMEPIAETTARCFAKTIPKRDLELAFDKWTKRGALLLKRICTSFGLSDAEHQEAVDLFHAILTDLSEVSAETCCKGEAELAGQKVSRMVDAYEPPPIALLRDYKGYY